MMLTAANMNMAALRCSCVVQKTADFLKANKLGHCVMWNPSEADGGEGVLPPFTPPAATPGSKQHAVS